MLINLSNHPSTRWSAEQMQAARAFGSVTDYPFPNVSPKWVEEDIRNEASRIATDILGTFPHDNLTVHLMGEFTLTYALLQRFHAHGIQCIASTTERIVKDLPDGKKEVLFQFVQFRRYEHA